MTGTSGRHLDRTRPADGALDAHSQPGIEMVPGAVRARRRKPGKDASTASLLVAAVMLLGLGTAAHWASDSPDGDTGIRASAPDLAAPGQVTPAPSPGTWQPRWSGSRSAGTHGSVSWQLMAAPDSDCRHFVETRERLPTITISIQNSCQ